MLDQGREDIEGGGERETAGLIDILWKNNNNIVVSVPTLMTRNQGM